MKLTRMGTIARLVDQYRYFLIAGLFLAVFITGVVGWLLTEPMGVLDAMYRSLTLFVLEGSAVGEISLPLHVARLLAPLTTSGAIVALALRVVRSQTTLSRASRSRRHTVVVGTASEAADIALGFLTRAAGGPRHRVVSIGELGPTDVVRLQRAGVLHLPAVSDVALRRILRRAGRVVVAAEQDLESSALSRRIRGVTTDQDLDTLVLLSDHDLADDWRHNNTDSVVCRTAHLASAILQQAPPMAEDRVSPSPIVIGDGPLAAEIARGIIIGWQQPGEALTVHAIDSDPVRTSTNNLSLEDRGEITWEKLAGHASQLPKQIDKLLAAWKPHRKAHRYRVAPATIYVAFDDETASLPVAHRIARQLGPRVHMVVVVADPEAWQPDLSSSNIQLVGTKALLCDPAHLCRSSAESLAHEIIADLGRWPDHMPSLFGPVQRTEGRSARLEEQPAEVREHVTRLAEAAESILGTAGLSIVPGQIGPQAVQVLDPEELTAAAREIASVIAPVENIDAQEQQMRRLELASRLPTLLSRTGRHVIREDRSADTLGAEHIGVLARAAHEGYISVAEKTGNATGSEFADVAWHQLPELEQRSNIAQILDIPVKLAILGLTYAPADTPRLYRFHPDDAELLSEQEHRRWEYFERRNARHDHAWNRPWSELPEETKDYDRNAVALIPALLAYLGLEVVASDRNAELRGSYTSVATRQSSPSHGVFERRGRAWAWQIDEPFSWETPRKDRLEAQPGDWWVITDDGSSRTVAPEAFTATYEQVEGQEYRRTGVVTARRATVTEPIVTTEGIAHAEPGDWVVTDEAGNTWPITDEVFTKLYARKD